MKKLYAMAILLLFLILGCESSPRMKLPTEPSPSSSFTSLPKLESSAITCDKYELLLQGMTIKIVEDILGRKADRYMQYLRGDQLYQTYTWINPNQSRIFVNLINGILVKKGEYLVCAPSPL